MADHTRTVVYYAMLCYVYAIKDKEEQKERTA